MKNRAMQVEAEWFDGFPYLVTRIGRTPLRHIALLPAGLSREQLLDLARRQAAANQLDTCLCLGPDEGVYVGPDGPEATAALLPWGLPITGRLKTAAPVDVTPELTARQARLQGFIQRHPGSGYLVGDGLEPGRPATAEDVARLSGMGGDGGPRGLVCCSACGAYRGEHLRTVTDDDGIASTEVVVVYCRCDNKNLCACCGGTLADTRLSAYHYDEPSRRVLYTAAYVGLEHRCHVAVLAIR